MSTKQLIILLTYFLKVEWLRKVFQYCGYKIADKDTILGCKDPVYYRYIYVILEHAFTLVCFTHTIFCVISFDWVCQKET